MQDGVDGEVAGPAAGTNTLQLAAEDTGSGGFHTQSGTSAARHTAAAERKRRQRSRSSPELYHASPAHYSYYPFPDVREPSASSSTDSSKASGAHLHPPPRDYTQSAPNTLTYTSTSAVRGAQQHPSGSQSYPDPTLISGRMAHGEDNITLRRREANRLAAQRFRSRKKGYQDSLEERIRVLEDERDALLRRLGETPEAPRPDDDPYLRYPNYAPSTRRSGNEGPGPSESPERRESVDVDVRVASLESANRHLQDELRAVYDENERLADELESWKRWDRERRAEDTRRMDDRHQTRAPHHTLEPGTFPQHTFPARSPLLPPPPALPSHPPLERARTFPHPPQQATRSGSPDRIRLPPLRLPPLPANISDARTLPSPSMMSLPPGSDPFRPPLPSPRAGLTSPLPDRIKLPDK